MTDQGGTSGVGFGLGPDLVEGIVETSPVGIVVVDADGEIVFANERAEAIYGRPRAEVNEFSHDDPRWDLVDADGEPLEDGEAPFDRVVDGEEAIYDQVLGLRGPSGERVWVSVNGAPQWDEDGELDWVVFTFEDITERERAQQQLQEERDMFADGPAVVFRWVPDEEAGWPVEYVSENVEDVLGYTPEALESGEVPYADLLLEAEVDRIAREVEENSDATTERFSHEPYRVETKEGEIRWVKDTTKIVRDQSGEITNYLGYLVDITDRKERERELEEYETIVETVNDGVYVVDGEGRFRTVNDAYVEMLGYDREELLGEHVSLVVDEDVVDRAQRAEAAMRRDDEAAPTIEAELQTADGDRLPSEATFALLPGSDGRERRVGVARDVSDRKERERQLAQHKQYVDDILDAIDDVFYVLTEDGGLQRWNESLCAVSGYTDDQIASMDPIDFFDEGDRDAVLGAIRDGFETGSVNVELELRTKSGERIPFEFAASTLEDPQGREVLAGIARDVSARVERERALEESERRYRTLAENFPNGAVGVYDRDLRYTLTEGIALGDTLPSADRLEGERMPEIFPEETAADLEPLFRTAIDEGVTDSTTTEFGGRNWRVWAAPLRDADDEVFAGLSFCQDVTEQVEHERKLQESNERLEQFAYAASHDLQEPLRMVSSYLQLLEDRYREELGDEGREFLEFAVNGADRMRNMIKGLLQYSRVDSQGAPFQPTDLDTVFEDVRTDLEVRVEETDAEITRDRLPSVDGDGDQLRQLFQNVLDNAIEYSGDAPPRVHVSAERAGDTWVLSVHDEGIGIDPEDQDRIFDVFERLHSRDEHTGTGIGLALCERIVDRHGGDMWIDSEPGEGTTVSFELPAADEN